MGIEERYMKTKQAQKKSKTVRGDSMRFFADQCDEIPTPTTAQPNTLQSTAENVAAGVDHATDLVKALVFALTGAAEGNAKAQTPTSGCLRLRLTNLAADVAALNRMLQELNELVG